MILIADSSEQIALAVSDSLILLDSLFAEVKVPRAVYTEVNKKSKKEEDDTTKNIRFKLK